MFGSPLARAARTDPLWVTIGRVNARIELPAHLETGSLGHPRRREHRGQQGHSGDAGEPLARPWRSRRGTLAKARAAARALGIPRAYGSYEELLADPDVEAIYNPLPNHLHVPWSIRAAQAGQARAVREADRADGGRGAQAARRARRERRADRGGVHGAHASAVAGGGAAHRRAAAIGPLRLVTGHFSYYRRDPTDIRSSPEWGGGALMDIGCYPIFISRWMFGAEPMEVVAMIERDPEFGIDRLTSAMLRFPTGQATFTCAGQLVPYQRMQLFGERGPHRGGDPVQRAAGSAVPDLRRRRLAARRRERGGDRDPGGGPVHAAGGSLLGGGARVSARSPVSLETAIGNMAVIDALFRSGGTSSGRTRGRHQERGLDRIQRNSWIGGFVRPPSETIR